MNIKIPFTICLFFGLTVTLQASPPPVFVSTAGNDTPQCGTSDAPCKTIQQAIDLAGSYSTIAIADGTYIESLSLNTPKGQLTLQCGWATDFSSRSADPGNTILQSEYSNHSTLLVQVATWTSTSITVEGCIVTGGIQGIAAVNSGGNLTAVFNNNHIIDNINDGIKIVTNDNSTSTLTISNNTSIAGSKNGINIYNSGTMSNTSLTLSSNHIHNNSYSGLLVNAFNKGKITADSENNFITRNENWQAAAKLSAMHTDSRITATFTNDTIADNTGIGAGLNAHAEESAAIEVAVRNSIIWGNSSAPEPKDIVAYSDQRPGFVASTTVTASYSDIGEVFKNPHDAYIEGSSNLNINPILQNNQHLTGNSPLIDAGRCGYYSPPFYIRIAPYIDIDGESRPGHGETTGCDIGADEYHASPLCFPVKASSGRVTIICM
jgi:hypothetical protein